MFVKDLGLEHGNSVQTSAVHDVTGDEPDPLDQTQASNHRSQDPRCLFLQSRLSRCHIHRQRAVPKNEKPHAAEPCKVEKASPIPENVIGSGDRCSIVNEWMKKWAGCKDTQKSSSKRSLRQENIEQVTRARRDAK